jgi:hypothetical protein
MVCILMPAWAINLISIRIALSKQDRFNLMSQCGSKLLKKTKWLLDRGRSSLNTKLRLTASVLRSHSWSRRSKRRSRRMLGSINRLDNYRNSFLKCLSINKTLNKHWKVPNRQLNQDINHSLKGCKALRELIQQFWVPDQSKLKMHLWKQALHKWS